MTSPVETFTAGATPAKTPLTRQQRALEELIAARMAGSPRAIGAAEQHVALTHLTLASSLARRYRNKGLETADLLQLANLGLVKAIKRWDPAVAEIFVPFAYVTILGDIRRYFRDQLHTIRPPRGVSEVSAHAYAAAPELEQRLGRPADRAEIAATIGVEVKEFDYARAAAIGCRVHSLDEPAVYLAALSDAGTHTVGHEPDTVKRLIIAEALSHLTPRQRQLVQLRFIDGLAQHEIGVIIGVSQMHVSRLLRQLLTELTPLLAPLIHDTDLASAS